MIIIKTVNREINVDYDYYSFCSLLITTTSDYIEVVEILTFFDFDGIVKTSTKERRVTISKKHIVEVVCV